jgi:hypothetical protein
MFKKMSALLDALSYEVFERIRRRREVDLASVWLDIATAYARNSHSPTGAAKAADELLRLFVARSKRFVVKSRSFARKTKAAEDALDGSAHLDA